VVKSLRRAKWYELIIHHYVKNIDTGVQKPEVRSPSPGTLVSQPDTAVNENVEPPPAKRMRLSSHSSLGEDASGDTTGVVSSQDTQDTEDPPDEVQGTGVEQMIVEDNSLTLLVRSGSRAQSAAEVVGDEVVTRSANTAIPTVVETSSPDGGALSSDTTQPPEMSVAETESTQND